MARSMTAYARAGGSAKDEGGWAAEIRSLNHRFFEFSLKASPGVYPLESRIREAVQDKVRRGKVSVTISNSAQEEDAEFGIDEAAVKSYLKASEALKRQFSLDGKLSLQDIFGLPRIFSAKKKSEDPDKIWKQIEPVLAQGLKILVKVKEVEGKTLAVDIRSRLDQIGEASKRIEKLSEGGTKRLFKKLSERVQALLGDASMDTEQLHREVAFLAERSDITEELVRLKSHLGIFKKRLDDRDTAELGRELDFLCQEINREVNTLGSKSQLFEISTDVIFIKKELEKIREQVQNIE